MLGTSGKQKQQRLSWAEEANFTTQKPAKAWTRPATMRRRGRIFELSAPSDGPSTCLRLIADVRHLKVRRSGVAWEDWPDPKMAIVVRRISSLLAERVAPRDVDGNCFRHDTIPQLLSEPLNPKNVVPLGIKPPTIHNFIQEGSSSGSRCHL